MVGSDWMISSTIMILFFLTFFLLLKKNMNYEEMSRDKIFMQRSISKLLHWCCELWARSSMTNHLFQLYLNVFLSTPSYVQKHNNNWSSMMMILLHIDSRLVDDCRIFKDKSIVMVTLSFHLRKIINFWLNWIIKKSPEESKIYQ